MVHSEEFLLFLSSLVIRYRHFAEQVLQLMLQPLSKFLREDALFLFTVAIPHTGGKQTQSSAFSFAHVPLLALLLLALPPVGRAGQLPQEPQENQKEPLGSLMTYGKVYVNESPAPAETTIFSGDRVRTEESGLATFNMSGKGSLKLAPHTEVIFSGKYEYTAELGAGSVVLNSVPGNNTFTLRIGSDVVVPSYKERTALASVTCSATPASRPRWQNNSTAG